MLDTIVKYVTGLVRLKGGTDGTVIGNTSDSLKVDTELPAQITMGNAMSNPTTPPVAAFTAMWNGSTWDRTRSQSDNADGVATSTNGHVATASHNFVFNGTSWDRQRGDATDGVLVNLGANNDVVVSATNLDIRDLTAADVVTANLSATDNAVLDTIATPVATIGATPLQRVAIFDAANTQITTFGGGTQYTEGDADASITGTAAMWEDATDTVRAVSMAKPLPVQPGTSISFPVTDNGGSLTVDGTVAVTNSDITTIASAIKAEDVASANADPGMVVHAVRQATVANSSGTDGDYEPLKINGGKLWVQGTAAEDVAHTTGDIGMVQLTRRIDTAAVSSGTSGDYSTMDVSAEGALWSTLTPTTTSGCSIARDIDLDNSTLTVVKASAGNLYGYFISNSGVVNAFVKFYNATSGTLGTGTPVLTCMIPAGASANVGFPYPISFGTGICVGAGTGVTDADNTDPGTNVVVANIFYK